jgi:hypothetical protein
MGAAAIGGVILGAVFGGGGGFLIRTLRGWIFVLAWALFVGAVCLAAGRIPFMGGLGIGALVGWVVAVPIKGILFLVRRVNNP